MSVLHAGCGGGFSGKAQVMWLKKPWLAAVFLTAALSAFPWLFTLSAIVLL